jgi:hypothetical protein
MTSHSGLLCAPFAVSMKSWELWVRPAGGWVTFAKLPVITVDREDFRVYRRNKREIIPLICPPED